MQPASPRVSVRALRGFAACALAGSIAVGVSACGSAGSSAAASAGGGTASSSGSQTSSRVKFAECMRSHGVDVPDPSSTGGPGPGGAGAQAFQKAQASPNFQSAIKACASLRSRAFGFANITPAQRQQFQHDAVKFAECMRAHNINIPDPTSNGAGGFGIFRGLRDSGQLNSPAFKSAMTACMSNLPNGGRFAPGAPGGSVGGPGA